jgi:DNA mismatch endonuclease (patch repair protein)
MTDKIDSIRRSENMRRVRSHDTVPEILVRKIAHRLGYRFRLHRRDLPGSPDLVFPKHNKIIFVHGCFWHRHPGCIRTTTPGTRAQFWRRKFAENQKRDRRVSGRLRQLGWKVLVVWECPRPIRVIHVGSRDVPEEPDRPRFRTYCGGAANGRKQAKGLDRSRGRRAPAAPLEVRPWRFSSPLSKRPETR